MFLKILQYSQENTWVVVTFRPVLKNICEQLLLYKYFTTITYAYYVLVLIKLFQWGDIDYSVSSSYQWKILLHIHTFRDYKCNGQLSLHKTWSFPLRVSLVNVNKSTGNVGNSKKSSLKNFIFCVVSQFKSSRPEKFCKKRCS